MWLKHTLLATKTKTRTKPSIIISKASQGTCEKHTMPTIVKIEMPCPKTPEMQTSQMAPTSMCPRQNSWPRIGFWERGHFIFWFQGLAAGASHCCWEALIKSISQICYENLRAEDLGAAQRTPDNGSKTAVAVWCCAQKCDTNGSVPHGTLGVPNAAPQHHCHCYRQHPLWSHINAGSTANTTAKPCTVFNKN